MSKYRIKETERTIDPAWGSSPEEHLWRYQTNPQGIDEYKFQSSSVPALEALVERSFVQTELGEPGARFHECLHYRVKTGAGMGPPLGYVNIENYPPVIGEFKYSTSGAIVRDWYMRQGVVCDLFDYLDTAALASWMETSCKPRADKYMRYPQNPLDTGFNLITFLRESREIIGLLKNVLRYKRTFKKLVRVVLSAVRDKHRGYRNTSMATAFRIIAKEHLTWAFGILPLVSDIKKIFRIVGNFQPMWEMLLSGRHRTYRYGSEVGLVDWPYRIPNVGGSPPNGGFVDLGQYKGVGGSWYTSTRISADCEWKGYLDYYLRCPDIVNGPLGGLLVFMDAFGVQPDPEIIWDAIPFSFVVDWFVSVGDRLHEFELDLVPVTMTVTDAMHHVRLRLVRDWYYEHPPVPPESPKVKVWQFSEDLSYFLRQRYLPVASTKTLMKKLELRHLALGTSLLAVRH